VVSFQDQRRRGDPTGGSALARHVIVGLLAVIAVILGAAALRASAVVTMPLAFAFFVAVLVHPIQRRLSAGLPSWLGWLSVLVTMLFVVGVLAVAIGLVWFSLPPVASRAPEYLDQLQSYWESLRNWAEARDLPLPQDLDWRRLASTIVQPLAWSLSWARSALALLAFLVLVFFFTLLMLIEASAWRRKTEAALRARRTAAVLDTVAAVAHKVRRYMLVRTVVGLISAMLATLWLGLLGVDFALFWGLVIFLLNYVPNIGSIISAIPPTVLAFLQFGFGWSLLAAGGLTALNQVMGNFVDPRLEGRTLDMSSLVVLLSVIFWGWIWGIIGALLAVPLTVTIILICAHMPALQPIAVLLSGDVDHEP
jgi:AI-2 transport protein TqsA